MVFLAVIPTFFIVSCAVLPTKLDRSLYTVPNQPGYIGRIGAGGHGRTRTWSPEVSAASKELDGVPVVTLVTAMVERITLTTNLVAPKRISSPSLSLRPTPSLKPRSALRAGCSAPSGAWVGCWPRSWAGAYHAYAQIRNKRIAGVLIQGIETAPRNPQNHTAGPLKLSTSYKEWLKEDQRNAGLASGGFQACGTNRQHPSRPADVAAFITDETKPDATDTVTLNPKNPMPLTLAS